MTYYQTKAKRITGVRTSEITKEANFLFHQIEKRTKRRPYLRSAYFRGEKIFLENLMPHLRQKSYTDRARRLRLLPCAIELIEKSHHRPFEVIDKPSGNEILYRFAGITGDQKFYVQIKEDSKRQQKFLMSVFPAK